MRPMHVVVAAVAFVVVFAVTLEVLEKKDQQPAPLAIDNNLPEAKQDGQQMLPLPPAQKNEEKFEEIDISKLKLGDEVIMSRASLLVNKGEETIEMQDVTSEIHWTFTFNPGKSQKVRPFQGPKTILKRTK
ncbi:MAG: hypothetical protein EB060_09055 [Proteobacteria bacterium]|nr:hypothetical protein [Pseudomonadota bacterium]